MTTRPGELEVRAWPGIRAAQPSPIRQPADSSDVQHRFRYTIDSQIRLYQGILQSSGTKRCKTDPGCRETKRLREMARVEQDDSIGARVWVLPHGPLKDARHDEKCRRLGGKPLIRAIGPRLLCGRLGRDPGQRVVLGVVVIEPGIESVHA